MGRKSSIERLPKPIRDGIFAEYVPGQEETGTPSARYVAAARAAQDWIAKYLAQQAARDATQGKLAL